MTSLLLLLSLASSRAATPVAGLEWRPLGRGDLTWIEDQRTTGLSVGEFDGFARPNLTAWFGAWLHPRWALTGSLGVARLQNTTLVEDVYRQRHWGVVRPALDVRFAVTERRIWRPIPLVLVGLYGNIPSVRDVSNGYTRQEQEAADELATLERARLAGLGARAGFGAEVRINDWFTVGGLYALKWHRSVLETDDTSIVTSWLAGEASLVAALEWPRR